MMKLVQKKRNGESEKPGSSGKVKKAKTGGGIQSGLQAFFNKSKRPSSSSNPAGSKKQKTPPTSPEMSPSRTERNDVEVIEIDSDTGDQAINKRKQVFDSVEVAEKKQK